MYVALINPPMAIAYSPSIQLGILRSMLNQINVSSTTFNLNIEFARLIGAGQYHNFANTHREEDPAIWFARKTWADDIPEYTGAIYEQYKPIAEKFIDNILELNWGNYDVFALSCTFDTIPAMCIGKHLKERFPNRKLIYGGSQFFEDASLELMKHLPWIDCIFVGESEYSFPEVIKSFETNTNIPHDILGVVFRENEEIIFNGVDTVDINDSPLPDYSEYFAQLSDTRDAFQGTVVAPYEASRGCWSGEKKHCKFCSLNHKMAFRSKKAETVYRELCQLYDSFHTKFAHIPLTDNILDSSYIHSLMHLLEADDRDFNLFVELKPNLKPHELQALSGAGFRIAQAGVETFYPDFVRLLDKGQSVVNCVSFLKWCKYYKIGITYNLLHHIPFEEAEWYPKQLEVIKKIVHLPLPQNCSSISIQRFGVYFQSELLNNLTPWDSYRFLYPAYMDIQNLAYLFDYDQTAVVGDEHVMPIISFLDEDSKRESSTFLCFLTDRLIIDTRNGGQRSYKLSKSQFDLLKFCLIPKTRREVKDKFALGDIEYLLTNDLLMALEGKILSLVEVEDGDLETIKTTSSNIIKKV